MLVIRFNRVGRHNRAQYRIVVQEKSKAPNGRHIAVVGSYDPHSKNVVLKEEQIKDWISKGAQPSNSVHNLLVRNKVINKAKRSVKLPEKKVEEKEEEKTEEVSKEVKKEEKVEAKKEKT
ncbi:MAG: 30S ribosomal protein S16 [Candidatus Moranbacteria bacterium]|nr:30S ribosomal protein S16 [Candidatus Moranbacteria bacterium]